LPTVGWGGGGGGGEGDGWSDASGVGAGAGAGGADRETLSKALILISQLGDNGIYGCEEE